MQFDKTKVISQDNIYSTFIGQFIKELEEKNQGYDDYTNFLYFLLHEKKLNKESKFVEYIDLLPRKPASPAFGYWDHSKEFEKEFEGHSIISK